MSDESFVLRISRLVARINSAVARRFARIVAMGPSYCIYCQKKSPFFLPYPGLSFVEPIVSKLDLIGSNLGKYSCPKCGANDRERHLRLYFERLGIDRLIGGARILHFAPEHRFGEYVASTVPLLHVKADLYPHTPDVQKIDMLNMDFLNESFDMVIANHVLEHVDNDAQALSEIRRVLRPGGLAILQTPYSAMLQTTFEDKGIISKSSRAFAYGQDDHVRLYGQDILSRFTAAGFISRVTYHEIALADIDPEVYGVNYREPFFLFERT